MEDEYIVEEYSDEDYDSSSSDDDVQIFLKKECGLLQVEDDFEKEVDQVMTAHLQKLKGCEEETPVSDSALISKNDSEKSDAQAKQDKINDELFYDPDMDDEDEKWINEKRRSYIYPSSSSNKNNTENKKLKPLPNSDAVLNCPACLSLLCLDCQRHDVYKSQYRAMFVSNCTVVETETLAYSNKKKFKKKKEHSASSNEKEIFNPVRCTVCNTEVAVYDKDEIYHFFNVLASY
ncbi:E2F-associated phosphoprotein like [Argiope bruennichi]|uniref:E2F-associated phosphoprotein like n=1 Tax=Argiope bruennichi TaxID=94029 RepID=A0A8T0EI51_ARGBR|nr:E2F-associated phosphoprotein like [Argiope bruennichi]